MNRHHKIFLFIILLVAAAVRLATVQYGTNVDEGVYWVEGKSLYDGYLFYRDVHFNKTPFVSVFATFFFLFGDAPIYPMRFAMLAVSLLGLSGVFLLAKELFGVRAALFALLLVALEPFNAIWSKYNHTSIWAPWLEAWILLFLVQGLKNRDNRRLFCSGVALGLFALTKQTAIYILPTGFFAWLIFSENRNIRGLLKEGGTWVAGICLLFIPFVLFVLIKGVFPAMWYDLWTMHHNLAPFFEYQDAAYRWNEWKIVFWMAPAVWLLPLGSLLFFRTAFRRELLFVWLWLLVELAGNVVFFTHLWRHYYLMLVPPAAILGGLVCERVITWFQSRSPQDDPSAKPLAFGALAVALAMIPFWKYGEWQYPGLTLVQERYIAQRVTRQCDTPYILNLTNPSLYVWLDKEIPPVLQDGRTTRLHYFMTLAGRGYLTREDMQQTVDLWKSLPIGCVVCFDKYIPQIDSDPLLEPLKNWLLENFNPPQHIAIGESYMGRFFLFERKDKFE